MALNVRQTILKNLWKLNPQICFFLIANVLDTGIL